MKGSLIKQHRKFNNMTLEELASGICSVSYLSKIEHDSINASDEIYRLLGERLNITLTNINQEFNEEIYQKLIEWHEACHLKDYSLMNELHNSCETALQENQNPELMNLYKIIEIRHHMTKNGRILTTEALKELNDIFPEATKEFQFLYYKTVGLHYLLKAELKEAIHYFEKAKINMAYLPREDNELYFHLALTYSRTQSLVNSTYYAQEALEGYKKDLHYSKIIDNYMIIAINYNILEAHSIAENYFLKILKVAKYHLTSTEQRRVYHNLGTINIHQENYSKALTYLKKASELETKDPHITSSTIYLLAITCYYSGDLNRCWEYIEMGEAEAERLNILKHKHKYFILRNMIHGTTHENEFTDKLEKEILPDFRKLNEYEDYKYYSEMLANLYYNKRMYKKSAMYFKEANNYKTTQKKDLL